MYSDRNQYGLPDMHYPIPEEIERAIGRAQRLRKQAFWDVMHVAAKVLTRAVRGRATAPAQAVVATEHAQTA